MATPNNTKAPQQGNPARETEGSIINNHQPAEAILASKPTLLGQAPAGLEGRFSIVPGGPMPEFCKLPNPRERCPLTGASRSWILDMEKAGRVKIVRLRKPGKMRGACFVSVPSLMALLRNAMEEQFPETQGQTNGAAMEGGNP